MSRKILGIDIRNDFISAVLVKSGIKGNWIEGYAQVPIPSPTAEEAEDSEGIIAALETVIHKTDAAGAACIVSMPPNQISFRNARVPFKDQKKIRQIIPFELEPTLPVPLEDVIIDFQPIKSPDTKDQSDIIAASVEKRTLKLYLDSLISLKTEPEIITAGGYAACLCLAKFSNIPENCLFMDIEDDNCTVFIIISGQIYLIRSFSINSNTGRTAAICTDIQRTLAAFEEIFPSLNFQPDEIHITGCGSDGFGFEPDAERILGIPVRRADIIHDTGALIKGPPYSERMASYQTDNAYALALTEIDGTSGLLNFRRGPFAPKKQWAEHKGSLIKIAALVCLILLAAFSNIAIEAYSTEKKLNELNTRITDIFTSTFPDKKVVEPLHQMRVELEEVRKNTFVPGGSGKNIRTVDMLNEISRRIPKETDVEFSRLVVSPDNISIAGETDTYNSVDDIKNNLEKAEIFKEVVITSSKVDKGDNRVSFKLRIQLN
jgi:hypothetical protein